MFRVLRMLFDIFLACRNVGYGIYGSTLFIMTNCYSQTCRFKSLLAFSCQIQKKKAALLTYNNFVVRTLLKTPDGVQTACYDSQQVFVSTILEFITLH